MPCFVDGFGSGSGPTQYLILAGDHVYRMDDSQLLDAHLERRADITIAALPSTPEDATSMGIFTFDRGGRVVAFEEKPSQARLTEMKTSQPDGSTVLAIDRDKPFIASMGIAASCATGSSSSPRTRRSRQASCARTGVSPAQRVIPAGTPSSLSRGWAVNRRGRWIERRCRRARGEPPRLPARG
ncbi:MAG: sugar phosphate nucleotidyltransferase [Acidobacteriota bacterium]